MSRDQTANFLEISFFTPTGNGIGQLQNHANIYTIFPYVEGAMNKKLSCRKQVALSIIIQSARWTVLWA